MTAIIDITGRYKGIKALVFGASGFIGSWVTRRLTAEGADLYLVVRPDSAFKEVFETYSIFGEVLKADLHNSGAAAKIISLVRPDLVFNLAGYGVDRSETDEAAARRINAELIAEIAVAASGVVRDGLDRTRVVHVGSALEYGESRGNFSEDSLAHPTTLYGSTKLEGTQALARVCEDTGMIGITARLFTVYGPGEHTGRLLPSLIDAAGGSCPVKLTAGLQSRDFTYVEDVAEGLLRLGLTGLVRGQRVNLATGKLTTVRDFTERTAHVLTIPSENLLFGTIPVRAEEQKHAPVTVERLRTLTGWIPTCGIEEGVRRAAEFLGTIQNEELCSEPRLG